MALGSGKVCRFGYCGAAGNARAPAVRTLAPIGVPGAMKVLILGGDGFCGWPTTLHLSNRGHEVAIVDNLSRRNIDTELEIDSLTPIQPLGERLAAWKAVSGHPIDFHNIDVARDYELLLALLRSFEPDVIVHFAEQRAAPYSMKTSRHIIAWLKGASHQGDRVTVIRSMTSGRRTVTPSPRSVSTIPSRSSRASSRIQLSGNLPNVFQVPDSSSKYTSSAMLSWKNSRNDTSVA